MSERFLSEQLGLRRSSAALSVLIAERGMYVRDTPRRRRRRRCLLGLESRAKLDVDAEIERKEKPPIVVCDKAWY